MFRIRKILDPQSHANRPALIRVGEIIRTQFPLATEHEITKLPEQLLDPVGYGFRSVVFVLEDGRNRVRGFALLLHLADLNIGYLEFISTAPETTSRGVGSLLYQTVRNEVKKLGLKGLFFECLPDEPHLLAWPELLQQNRARLKFYERFGARPILNTHFDTPVSGPENDLFFLVMDPVDREIVLTRREIRKIVRAILERKYGEVSPPEYIDRVLSTFADDPVRLRPFRYIKKSAPAAARAVPERQKIALVSDNRHQIHHIRERGYVEAPVRIPAIRKALDASGLFDPVPPRRFPDRHLQAVHDRVYLRYLKKVCASMSGDEVLYPSVFPIRNQSRPPRDLDMRAGYFCLDSFTPIHRNSWPAARCAVDAALTGAALLLSGRELAYALIRPPGHHAEARAFGGFCYLNSAAVAARYLSEYGRVAVLDIDYHHGNGTEEIFYKSREVLTVSIHCRPEDAYPFFSGFEKDRGAGEGKGYNRNFPLPEGCEAELYLKTAGKALRVIDRFKPDFLVLCLGYDTAKGDPTGSFTLAAEDFRAVGRLLGSRPWPTLIVQEGGYLIETLGDNARAFFDGLWEGSYRNG